MKRTTRMAVGLVAIIPLLGILGGVLVAADVGIATAWILLAVAVAWLLLVIWWARQAPADPSAEGGKRFWSPVNQSRYRGRG